MRIGEIGNIPQRQALDGTFRDMNSICNVLQQEIKIRNDLYNRYRKVKISKKEYMLTLFQEFYNIDDPARVFFEWLYDNEEILKEEAKELGAYRAIMKHEKEWQKESVSIE